MQPTTDVYTPAFELLASAANDFHLHARPCLGATLKPKLASRGFDERTLGFAKFGAFLRAAERAGYVKLGKTSGGDIAIFPSNAPASPSATILPPVLAPFSPAATLIPSPLVSSNIPLHVRQDLWNAFNSHSDKWVYDPNQDRAFRADTEGFGMPTTGLVAIPPGRERIAAWMRAFTDQQEPRHKESLTAALDRGAESYQFSMIASANGLQRSWRRFHIQQTLKAIEAWANEHGLHPNNVATAYRTPSADQTIPPKVLSPSPTPPATPRSVASAQLNARLESLIDHLITDLISLRGLIAITEPKQPS